MFTEISSQFWFNYLGSFFYILNLIVFFILYFIYTT